MALPKMVYLGCLALLLAVIVVEAATPPGIAKNPARASCKLKKYKMCYNLEHVCPKFCPDSCTVECASCKPICSSGPTPPPSDDDDDEYSPPSEGGEGGKKGGDDDEGGKKGGDDDDDDEGGKKGGDGKDGKKDDDEGGKKGDDDDNEGGKKGGDDDDNDDDEGGKKGSPPPYYPPSPTTPTPPSPTPTPPTPSPPTKTPPSPTPPSPSPSPPSTPTPTPSTPSSPPPGSSGVASRKKVRCKSKNYGQCYNQDHVCPASCPTSCQVDCVSCKPVCSCDYPGAVCQDPRFIGGDGITFYFHGRKDQDFCLVTDRDLHINAHFIGKRNNNMGRDFTWVQSIGILFDNHRLFVGAKKTSTWDDAKDRLSLAYDGQPIYLDETLGHKWQSTSSPQVTITRTNSETNNIVIKVQGKLKIAAKVVPITKEDSRVHNYGITDEDCFAHLDLGFKFNSLTAKVDGVLGKTYRDDYISKVNVGAPMAVVGGERDYASSSIFATDCLASRFDVNNHRDETTSLEALELANMKCSSGMNGEAGIVCKR